ncbi:MAG: hypothetical protein WCN92_07540 [Eubacteriales bacterium]
MTVDNKNQEKEQSSENLIEKLNEAEIAVLDGGWLTPEEIETSFGCSKSVIDSKLKESAIESKSTSERFDFFTTAAEMRKELE